MTSLQRFIDANPYPSYEEADAILSADIRDMGHTMAVVAEYGQGNHKWLKAIYDSKMDREVAREMGQKIYDAGGFQAMQMNYYAFQLISPFRKSRSSEIYGASNRLQYLWDGVGEWES
jgi:hypothetical protein